jgi:hypothetical protein
MSTMFRCLISTIAATAGLANAAVAQEFLAIGSAQIAVPTGWRQIAKEPERITLRSQDGRQQATITLLRFASAPRFSEFERICEHRLKAEKEELGDGFLNPSPPFQDAGSFGMFFSGGDKKIGRLFSGYLSLVKTELIAVYVEGIGLSPKDHLASFQAYVRGLKRR